MFALVVVRGLPKNFSKTRESLCAGTRKPIVFDCAFKKCGSDFLRFTIIVSGPGQYFFARFWAAFEKNPYFLATVRPETIMEMGLLGLIFLIL